MPVSKRMYVAICTTQLALLALLPMLWNYSKKLCQTFKISKVKSLKIERSGFTILSFLTFQPCSETVIFFLIKATVMENVLHLVTSDSFKDL